MSRDDPGSPTFFETPEAFRRWLAEHQVRFTPRKPTSHWSRRAWLPGRPGKS